MLTTLKNELFESDELIDNHLISQSEWDETKNKLKIDLDPSIEKPMLQEIRHTNGLLNLEKFMDILDLF